MNIPEWLAEYERISARQVEADDAIAAANGGYLGYEKADKITDAMGEEYADLAHYAFELLKALANPVQTLADANKEGTS